MAVLYWVFSKWADQSLAFKKKEIETLEEMAGHVSLALVGSHRAAVEKWRIEQLTLVRRVSAQIANVLDMDELTRRVTKLIQRTFNYYYVAVFTHQAGQEFAGFPFKRRTSARTKKTAEGPAGRRSDRDSRTNG